jgi:hypothetical protein
LGFWQQAKSQEDQRNLTIEDSWLYFLHGWTEVIVEVLDIKLADALFRKLAEVVEDLKSGLIFTPR